MSGGQTGRGAVPQRTRAQPTPLVPTLLRGMAIGAADVVPGVSGGTIAFISGIYERLLAAIASVPEAALTLRAGGLKAAWARLDGTFLTTLITGILISIFSLAKGITWALHTYPVVVWAFFFGLVVASVVYVARQVRGWNAAAIAMLLLGTGLIYGISVMPPLSLNTSLPFLFFAGALASCAMILPGISGSFLLLLIGAYAPVLAAVAERDLGTVAVVALGAALGLLLFTRALRYLLREHHTPLLGLLTGFLVGSLWKIWPWKTDPTVYHKELGTVPIEQLTGGQYASLAPYLQTLSEADGELLKAYVQHNVSPATYAAGNLATSADLLPALVAAALGFALVLGLEWLGERAGVAEEVTDV